MRVLLIAGGWSSERAVSLRGAEGIASALQGLGHELTFFDLMGLSPEEAEEAEEREGASGKGAGTASPYTVVSGSFDTLMDAASQHDFAFINLHGAPGEDGLIQAMLEQAQCPYQGSGPTASFLALHKAATKQVLRRAGMLTPDWLFVPTRTQTEGLMQRLAVQAEQRAQTEQQIQATDLKQADRCKQAEQTTQAIFPLFVKSNDGGSSLLLSRVDNEDELYAALDDIFDAGCEALVEPCIDGVEITCGILGDEALPPIMIVPKSGTFFDYHNKYTVGAAQEICPAPISPALTARVQALALQAHKALGLEGYSRADFIARGYDAQNGADNDDSVELFLLEVNTLPGMTITSLVPQEAAAIGLDFPALITRLMDLGLQRASR